MNKKYIIFLKNKNTNDFKNTHHMAYHIPSIWLNYNRVNYIQSLFDNNACKRNLFKTKFPSRSSTSSTSASASTDSAGSGLIMKVL